MEKGTISKLEHLQTGVIILHRTPASINPISWVAAAIRFFTKSKYNHVSTVVNNWRVPFINEAIEKGITATSATERLIGQDVKILMMKGLPKEKEWAKKANAYLGNTGYDFTSLLLFQPILILTKKWIGRKEGKADRKLYCSEYVAKLIYETYNISSFKEWWTVAPVKIEESTAFEVIFEGKINKIIE